MILLSLLDKPETMTLLGHPRGHRIEWRLGRPGGRSGLITKRILSPRTRASGTTNRRQRSIAGTADWNRRSSCLSFQLLRIEVHSFLPQHQDDGGNLTSQREPRHVIAHALGQ